MHDAVLHNGNLQQFAEWQNNNSDALCNVTGPSERPDWHTRKFSFTSSPKQPTIPQINSAKKSCMNLAFNWLLASYISRVWSHLI